MNWFGILIYKTGKSLTTLVVLFCHKNVMKKFLQQMKQEIKYKSIFDYILVNHTDPMDRIW